MNSTAWHALRDRLTLSQRFAATGGIVMLMAMVTIGLWVTRSIERNVIDNSADATALYMDSFIAPLAQELVVADTLSIGPIRAIEEMLGGSELGKRIVAVKIWKVGGLVAYSDDAAIVGKRFQPSESLTAALSGRVMAELDDLSNEENSAERAKGMPLLEIYSPLRQAYSGRILGAMEIYENATDLEAALDSTRLQTWAIVAAVTLAIGSALFGIVHSGSRLIASQAEALKGKIVETERVSEQNRRLRLRVERASRRVSEVNERTLRRIGAELHDGPKQLIGLAALRLGAIGTAKDDDARQRDIAIVSSALAEALRDIGLVCADLSAPDIEALTITDVLRRVAAAHGFRTGTPVDLDLVEITLPVAEAVRIGAYRFTQEALNNAFWHAGGVGQKVACGLDGSDLWIRVTNGPGTPARGQEAGSHGLGLPGLRDRIESLGGRFSFVRTGDRGAVAEMRVGLEVGGERDD